jgi:acyl-CoA synthetase (AMP-forming)/AMP-acid ligase II
VRGENLTIMTLLQMRAEQQPNFIPYTFVADRGPAVITYAELDRRARAIGRMLTGRHMRGTPVMLLYAPGLDYLAGFFGCLYAGAIAVPADLPERAPAERQPGGPHSRLAAIARDAMPSGVLTSTADDQVRLELAVPELSRLEVMTTDGLPGEDAWQPSGGPESVALLQYTSGSTAAPKGVALTHRNLMSNSEAIFRLFGHGPDSRAVSWLPFSDSMGLINGVIQPLYGGFPVTLLAPAHFMRRPARWLEEISRVRATTSGGPQFAYELCLRKTSRQERAQLDLSSWRVAFTGGEPVRAQTMNRFARAFAVSGFRPQAFRPCYGLAEATFLVTGGTPWSPDEAESCGAPAPGQRVLIVDQATRTECAPGETGEIWVAGPSAARSYWRRPAETRQVLEARLAGQGQGEGEGEGPFVRSGDLGFMLGHRLHFAGRIADLIVIRGRHYRPQDIELTVAQSSPVLRHGRVAAFTVADDGEERLVTVSEVSRPTGRLDAGQVAAAIRAAVAAEHCLQVHTVVLLPPGVLPETSRGEVQRRRCAVLFERGRLPELSRSVLAPVPEGSDLLRLRREALLALPSAVRRELLHQYLRRLMASTRQVEETDRGDTQRLALGTDTPAMISIRYSVKTDLGVHLTLADLSTAAGLGELAARLDELLAVAAVPSRREAVPAARSLWFMRNIDLAAGERGTAIALRIRGELNPEFLDRAVDALVARPAVGAGSAPRPRLREIDVGQVSDAKLADRLERAACEPFSDEPLLRIHLYRRAALDPVLLVVAHQLIADFWSLSTLIGEFELLFAGGEESVLAPPDLSQFVRYYSWISEARAPAPASNSLRHSINDTINVR